MIMITLTEDEAKSIIRLINGDFIFNAEEELSFNCIEEQIKEKLKENQCNQKT